MVPPPWGENDLSRAGEWLESNADLVEEWIKTRASSSLTQRLRIAALHNDDNHPPLKAPANGLSNESSKSPELIITEDSCRRTSTNSNVSITFPSPSKSPQKTALDVSITLKTPAELLGRTPSLSVINASPNSFLQVNQHEPTIRRRNSDVSPSRSSASSSPETCPIDQVSANRNQLTPHDAAISISRRTSIASCHLSNATALLPFTSTVQIAGKTLATNVSTPGSVSSRRTSITSDLFQLWLAASPVKASASGMMPAKRDLTHLDESELFMELIRDVANELDLDTLCHKILVNVGLLTHADRGSLFLARGPAEDRYLVAKLFDVTQDTELDDAVQKARTEELRIPFGVGIAGTVAQTKEIINIRNAYEDPRFNRGVDTRTGYKTNLILCMPICNYEGDVIGVAQIINKTNGSEEFTEHDVEVFQRYLTFCGIGIQNAQLFEISVLEYRRNQILLNLARSIFEEQNNLECLVTKIMREAQELLKCERCAVFLLDLDCCEASHLERIVERPNRALPEPRAIDRKEPTNVSPEDLKARNNRSVFTTVFELREAACEALIARPTVADLQHSTLAQIASYVANTGQILNISDIRSWLKAQPDADAESAHSILCMPIVNGEKSVIGVAQLINKANNALFTDGDVSLFEAFAIFCGLGIHNTQMYENACKLMAKQKVALECLSYHATASNEATLKLTREPIPSAESYNLYSFKFIDFELSDDDTCRATLRMFLQCNLVEQFHIPYDVLCRWILSVRKNYRPVKYHNWRHALNVAQTMFAMLKTGKMERFMTDLEILGLLVACLCHDLDHRGTNNAFQTKTESPLAILYTTSTMEHHHFDQCVMILNSDCNNIFQALSPEDYKNVMHVVETAILSTDLAMYFKKRSRFLELIENGEFDWQSQDKKELLCGMMMTACDVSAIAKPWEVQHRIAKLVADEFFDQGDLEKMQLKQQPVAMMDRERKDELPQMQVGFIDVICLPLYRVMTETFPWMEPLYVGTMENRKNWQDLAEKVEMGLTWIDHDTIDKPIETFAETEAVEDLEFTVTTLHQQNTTFSTTTTTSFKSMGAHRNRLASMKGRSLSRAVRARLSRSLYSHHRPASLTQSVEQTSIDSIDHPEAAKLEAVATTGASKAKPKPSESESEANGSSAVNKSSSVSNWLRRFQLNLY